VVRPNHARVCHDRVPDGLARPGLPVASAVNLDWWCGLGGELWRRAMSDVISPQQRSTLARAHWSDCAVFNGPALSAGPCSCGGFTIGRLLAATAYHHAHNLAAVFRMFRLGIVRRAFRLSAQAPIPPARWVPFPWPEVRKRRADGETLKALAKSYGVTHPTIIRTLRKFEAPIPTM
jgi:hypothetical protein